MTYGVCRFALLLVLSLFVSCAREHKTQPYSPFSNNQDSSHLVSCNQVAHDQPINLETVTTLSPVNHHQENLFTTLELAQQIEIPVPVNYSLLDAYKNDDEFYFVSYHGNLPAEKIHAFYLREMDRLGWNIIDFSNNKEGLLVCDTMTKYCSVSIRQEQQRRTNIYIFIRPKNKK
ncbi:MAG: hypothetical protein V1855_02010 [bacterium]